MSDIKINNKTYHQKDLIIVFEDFDANNNDILKVRENLKAEKNKEIENKLSNKNETNEDFMFIKIKDCFYL